MEAETKDKNSTKLSIDGTFYQLMSTSFLKRKTAAREFMDSVAENIYNLLWLKNNVNKDVNLFILTNCEEGIADKILPNWVKLTFLGESSRIGQILNFLISGVGSFSNNVDFLLEVALIFLLGRLYSESNQGDLPAILLIAMASLITFPLFVDFWATFAETDERWKKLVLLCFFPVFPLFSQAHTNWLMWKKAPLEYKIAELTLPNPSINMAQKISESSDLLEMKHKELEAVKTHITKKRFLETILEGQPQGWIKMILVILILSKTKIVTGVEAVFVNLELFGIPSNLLVLSSILIPIWKNSRLYLTTLDRTLTTGGQLALTGFAFFCLLAKSTGIVAASTSALGLFSSLGHWQERQKAFTCAAVFPPNGDGNYYGLNMIGEQMKTPWTSFGVKVCQNGSTDFVDILTKNATDWQPESTPFYNWFDLTTTCWFVLCLGLFRLLAVYAAKHLLSEDFRKVAISTRLCHILYKNLGACPVTFSEWEKATTFPDIWKKYVQERREMWALLVIDFIENLVLLVPLTLSFISMTEYHALLEDTIGVTDIEQTSYRNCLHLLIFSYSIMASSLVLCIVLYHVYNHHVHLWKSLLNEASKIWMEEELELTSFIAKDFDNEVITPTETIVSIESDEQEEVFFIFFHFLFNICNSITD